MRSLRAALIFATGAALALHAAEPAIEFAGVLTADGKPRIALKDKMTGTTHWLELGDAFNGYAVARYDADNDAVFLKKDGRELRLALVVAKSNEVPAVSAPAAATATTPAPTTASALVPSTAPLPAPSSPAGSAPATEPVLAPTGPVAGVPAPAPASTESPPAPPRYTIQGGDTWQKISENTGVPVPQLQALNPILNGGSLPAGQTIRIR